VSNKSVHLHKDLQLSKKSARWVTKLLDEEMKNNILTVVGSTRGEERDGQPFLGVLLEGAGGGYEFTKAF
jgi:hypothetical protein